MNNIEPKSDTWCIHFTGIMNKTCKVGVSYADMRDSASRLPCILANDSQTICRHRQAPTSEQVELGEKQLAEAVTRFFTAMNNGRCHHCGKILEHEKQNGRSVYGSCGCRLWQGKARKKAELQKLQAQNNAG